MLCASDEAAAVLQLALPQQALVHIVAWMMPVLLGMLQRDQPICIDRTLALLAVVYIPSSVLCKGATFAEWLSDTPEHSTPGKLACVFISSDCYTLLGAWPSAVHGIHTGTNVSRQLKRWFVINEQWLLTAQHLS
jgi:hypothetical protein